MQKTGLAQAFNGSTSGLRVRSKFHTRELSNIVFITN